MIARRFCLVVVVVAFLAWTGCQPTDQALVGNQQDHASVQKEAIPIHMQSKLGLDDDAMRVRLLLAETVQKDLGLTDDQIGKIRDYVKITGESYRKLIAKSREILPPSRHFPQKEAEVRNREFRALINDVKSKDKELQKKILAMLTPSQSERLKQIRFQVAIPAALTRPEIIKALDISKEQRGRIRELCDRMKKQQSAAWHDLAGLNREERRQKVLEYMRESHELQVETTKPILDVLTPEQRAKLGKLLGRKIEVTWSDDELVQRIPSFDNSRSRHGAMGRRRGIRNCLAEKPTPHPHGQPPHAAAITSRFISSPHPSTAWKKVLTASSCPDYTKGISLEIGLVPFSSPCGDPSEGPLRFWVGLV